MKFSLKLPDDDRRLILVLAAVFLLTRLPPAALMPMVGDEAIYAMMIEEQIRSPSLVPTFLSHPISWKPALFFWAYSALPILPPVLPLELEYRLPSLIFGLASVPLIYSILRGAGGASRALAFFSTLIYLLSFSSLYPNSSLLLDSMTVFLICLSLWIYMRDDAGPARFVACAALSFIAYFTKFILAAMIPVLAIAYFYFNGRKALRHPLFLLSLLAVPLAMALNAALFSQAGITTETAAPFASHLLRGDFGSQLNMAFGAIVGFFLGVGFWAPLAIWGIASLWREKPFMALWAALAILPLAVSGLLFWYYMPALPAIAFFAASMLLRWEGKERPDALFMLIFCMVAALSLGLGAYMYLITAQANMHEMEAGKLLAGKENVLIIGRWPTTLVGYKALTEYRELGAPLDFGWITSPGGMEAAAISEFVRDYRSTAYPAVQGSFNEVYTTGKTFRKDTNLSSFDYVAIAAFEKPPIPNSTVVYDAVDVTIYKIARG